VDERTNGEMAADDYGSKGNFKEYGGM